MIRTIEVSIRAWYPTGDTILPSTFISILNVDVNDRRPVGTGEPWQAARIVLAELNLDSFNAADEPHEAFHKKLTQMLRQAGEWISTADYKSLAKSRSEGLSVDVFVEVRIDDNQLELLLPVEFLAQVTRLQLPIEVMADS